MTVLTGGSIDHEAKVLRDSGRLDALEQEELARLSGNSAEFAPNDAVEADRSELNELVQRLLDKYRIDPYA